MGAAGLDLKPRNEDVTYRIWKGDKVFVVGHYKNGEKSGTILYIGEGEFKALPS